MILVFLATYLCLAHGRVGRTSGADLLLTNDFSIEQRVSPNRDSWCIPMPEEFSICRNANIGYDGYRNIRLPNFWGHDSIEEIKKQMDPWRNLVQTQCHPNLSLFLCSIHAPLCIEEPHYYIKPCRALCEEVRESCEPRMSAYGFPWPENMACNRYPDPPMCMNHNKTSKYVCDACKQPTNNKKDWMDRLCRAHIIYRVKVASIMPMDGTKHKKLITYRKVKNLITGEKLFLQTAKEREFRIRSGANCECNITENGKTLIIMGRKSKDGKYTNLIGVAKVKRNKVPQGFRSALKRVKTSNGCRIFKRELFSKSKQLARRAERKRKSNMQAASMFSSFLI